MPIALNAPGFLRPTRALAVDIHKNLLEANCYPSMEGLHELKNSNYQTTRQTPDRHFIELSAGNLISLTTFLYPRNVVTFVGIYVPNLEYIAIKSCHYIDDLSPLLAPFVLSGSVQGRSASDWFYSIFH